MAVPNYYLLLRIARDADVDEIRHAYVRQVKHSHPDLVGPRWRPSTPVQDLQAAYRCLLDPEARRRHDEALAESEQAHAARLHRVQRRLKRRTRGEHVLHRGQKASRRHLSGRWRLALIVLIGVMIAVKAHGLPTSF